MKQSVKECWNKILRSKFEIVKDLSTEELMKLRTIARKEDKQLETVIAVILKKRYMQKLEEIINRYISKDLQRVEITFYDQSPRGAFAIGSRASIGKETIFTFVEREQDIYYLLDLNETVYKVVQEHILESAAKSCTTIELYILDKEYFGIIAFGSDNNCYS
jgi:hypothetical protein